MLLRRGRPPPPNYKIGLQMFSVSTVNASNSSFKMMTCCLLRLPSQTRSTSPPFWAMERFTRFANVIASSPLKKAVNKSTI